MVEEHSENVHESELQVQDVYRAMDGILGTYRRKPRKKEPFTDPTPNQITGAMR